MSTNADKPEKVMNPSQDFYVLFTSDDDEKAANLHVQLTDEGIIANLFCEDKMIGTWAYTAQDLVDDFITE